MATKKREPACWLRRLTAPVRRAAEAEMLAAGYGDDPDGWVVAVLTTAQLAPRGYLLRLPLRKADARQMSEEAAQAELFSSAVASALEVRP